MSKAARIQVPISSDKKKMLEEKSFEAGFDSVTETVRFLINGFLRGTINITVSTVDNKLDKKTELEVLEGLLDVAKGRTQKVDPLSESFHQDVLDIVDE